MKRMPVDAKSFLLLHAALLLYAVVSVFAKYAGIAMAASEMENALLWLGLELLALMVYTILWQLSLRRMPLSFAYSNKAICTLWIFLFGMAFFGESLTIGKAAGILVTLAGVYLVVTDDE